MPVQTNCKGDRNERVENGKIPVVLLGCWLSCGRGFVRIFGLFFKNDIDGKYFDFGYRLLFSCYCLDFGTSF